MSETTPRQGAQLQSLRQRTIDQLCERFADDLISVGEFERRVDQAHRVETAAELDALLADLPSASNLPARADQAARLATPGSFPSVAPFPETAHPTAVKERDFMLGFWGGSGRKGRWTPARKCLAIATMGGVELDFRDAVLPEHTEITAIAIMGGVEIIVPPGVVVDTGGLAIMGGFEHEGDSATQPPPGAPSITVKGLALMGGVSIETRFPGESARDARRRNRALLKARRRQLSSGD